MHEYRHDPSQPLKGMPSVAVIVSSDRAHDGVYADRSGPAAIAWLETRGMRVVGKVVVPDGWDSLRDALANFIDSHVELIVVSGGTGLGPRDLTPQVLDQVCDYQVPGFGEFMRRESLKYTANAYMSRCGAWVKGHSFVLALPGSPKAVTEQLDILSDLLPHALKAMRGECAHRTPAEGP